MTYNSKDFIFNSALEYPPIIDEGVVTAGAFETVTLKTGVPVGSDYHVFGRVTNVTYGNGLRKITCWVNAAGELKANTSAAGPVYWRLYGY